MIYPSAYVQYGVSIFHQVIIPNDLSTVRDIMFIIIEWAISPLLQNHFTEVGLIYITHTHLFIRYIAFKYFQSFLLFYSENNLVLIFMSHANCLIIFGPSWH